MQNNTYTMMTEVEFNAEYFDEFGKYLNSYESMSDSNLDAYIDEIIDLECELIDSYRQ